MEIKKEDIPYNMINMLNIVGMENLLRISKVYGGANLYIPLLKELQKEARNREIIKAYNGFNAKELSEIYDLSVSQIHRIRKRRF